MHVEVEAPGSRGSKKIHSTLGIGFLLIPFRRATQSGAAILYPSDAPRQWWHLELESQSNV